MCDKRLGLKQSPMKPTMADRSFVESLRSKVSGILPSTLARWLRSGSSPGNGSATVAESMIASTEDATKEPPKKRRRCSPSAQIDNNHSISDTESMEPFDAMPSTSSSTSNLRESVCESVQQNDEHDIVEAKASARDNEFYIIPKLRTERKRKSIFNKSQDTNAIIEDAVASSASATSLKHTKPYFKAGLLSSPFYSGRTSYGGAAWSYTNQPNIRHRKEAVIKKWQPDENVTMSQSARNVMDILENYSSPLKDAKRIPPLPLDIPQSSSASSPRTQELHVPQIAAVIKLKHKQLTNTTNASRQLLASFSSSTPLPAQIEPKSPFETPPEKRKLVPKLKSREERPSRETFYKRPIPCNLPTEDNQFICQHDFETVPTAPTSDLTNCVNTLPKVSENISITFVNTIATSSQNQTTNLPEEKENQNESEFDFCSPLNVSVSQPGNSTSYNFDSPERNLHNANSLTVEKTSKADIDNIQNNTSHVCSCKSGLMEKSECLICEKQTNNIDTAKQLPISNDSTSDKWKCNDCCILNDNNVVLCILCGRKKLDTVSAKPFNNSDSAKAINNVDSAKWKCKDCWVQNDSNSVTCQCCGARKSTETASTKPINNTDSAKWKCKDCWIENDINALKCVCCGYENTSASISNQTKYSPSLLKNKDQSNDGDWKCDVCLIRNASIKDKCAACSNPKPGSNSASASSNLPLQSDTQSKSKWECSICLVMNENDKTNCVCCEAEKPGTKKMSGTISFKDNPGAMFKFGIPPGTKQEASVKLPTLVEANNNVLPKASFKFGIEKVEQESPKPTEIPQEKTIKETFTFGINKPLPSSASTEIPKPQKVETILSSLEKTVETSKSVPPLLFGASIPNISVSNSLLAPAHSTLSEKSLSFSRTTTRPSNNVPNVSTFEHYPINTNSIASTVTTTLNNLEPKAPSSTTFSAGNRIPSANLFAPTVPSSAATTSLSPILPFKSSIPISSLPVFGSNTTTTSTALPTATAAPVFNFTSLPNNNALDNNKPKFNFTFGSKSSTETPSMFKPFGANESNTFSTPTASNVQTLATNGLSGASTSNNGIPTINTLPSGNTLSSDSQLNQPNPTGAALSPPATRLFANTTPTNAWPANSSNTSGSPAPFTFGSRQPFGAISSGTFTLPQQPQQPPQAQQPQQTQQLQQNLFGMSSASTNNTPPSFFTPSVPAMSQNNPFGNSTMRMFDASNNGLANSFALPNTPPSFEIGGSAQPQSFNFGSSATRNVGFFGMTQQQQQQQQQQPQPNQIYNFEMGSAAPQVQFNMGSAPSSTNPAGRRVRRAVRRTQR